MRITAKQSRAIAPLRDGEPPLPPTPDGARLCAVRRHGAVLPRSGGGRFGPGNPGGPGNPYARRVAAIRSALLAAVSDEDVRAIVAALVRKAKGGDIRCSTLEAAV